MNNYKTAKAILKSITKRAKNGERIAYAITTKGFWLDYPKERTIRIFTYKNKYKNQFGTYTIINPNNVGNFIFN